jgi:DNA modification methylase
MTHATAQASRNNVNKPLPQDRPVHDWYRFVLSFPPHLVRQYAARFGLDSADRVLDPFCGTGTTIVECKKLGVPSVGIESNHMPLFATQVKVDWSPDPDGLLQHARHIAATVLATLRSEGIEDDPLPLFGGHLADEHKRRSSLRTLPLEKTRLLLKDSISPLPLHKTLVLIDCLEKHADDLYRRHELLALAKALVYSISNLHFGPEVGIRSPKPDAPVVTSWLKEVHAIARDLRALRGLGGTPAEGLHADSREPLDMIPPQSIAAVITSPPYPNEKDYTRTTRLESVLLGFIRHRNDLRALKHTLVRSNTRGVYRYDDDDQWAAQYPEIQQIADAIEKRRIELGKTSGFERMYSRVTRLYFGGMARHLANLRELLRPGAQLAYVVGDQASYLRIMIRTGELLAAIAESLGYEVQGIDLFRTRLATASREQLREEVVVFRWPGS